MNLKRELGLFSATVLVVANMIGTGIFTTSGFIMAELGNPRDLLLCWFFGGLFALAGALCYGELGAALPRAGGEYAYLRKSFGRGAGFLSGWISLVVGFSAPIAAGAMAFASYFFRTFPGLGSGGVTFSLCGITLVSLSPSTLLAVAVIIVLSLVHYHSLAMGARVQNVLTIFKITLVLGFITAALAWGRGSFEHFSQGLHTSSLFQERFAVSLIFVFFAYSGWNAAAYVGSEIKRPQRNIPLALIMGTGGVTVLYLLLNGVYIYALAPDEMKGVLEVGAKAATSLFGLQAGRYVSSAIALGLLSVLSAMIMAGPRVYYAMSRDGLFFSALGRVRPERGTPGGSIFLQAAIAVFMVITASFESLLVFIGFTLSLCAMVTVVGMMRLRFQNPTGLRPFKTPGYPVTPVLFILGNLWIIYFTLKSRPLCALSGLGTIGLGLLLFFYFKQKKGSSYEI